MRIFSIYYHNQICLEEDQICLEEIRILQLRKFSEYWDNLLSDGLVVTTQFDKNSMMHLRYQFNDKVNLLFISHYILNVDIQCCTKIY